MKRIEPDEFIRNSGTIPVVDVRSPSEYQQGHITGSVNIPLFDDHERAVVGTIYKQSGRTDAIDKGLELVGPKLQSIARQAKQIASKNDLLVYCWRGGMRSEKMSWLFETVGINCQVLKGGYKVYRKQLAEDFAQIQELIVLHGATGSGKTEILQQLEKQGEQVIDLEKFARHKGSAFGHLGQEKQPTTVQFQNDIHRFLMQLNLKLRIWIEGESLSIGKVYLPDTLWNRMNHAKVVKLQVPKQKRIKRIVEQYGWFDKELLMEAVKKIEKRFGPDRTKSTLLFIQESRLEEATDMLLDYYDKNYSFSLDKYKEGKRMEVDSDTADPEKNAKLILETLNHTQFHD